ncbi:MAG TPA: tripartite tricarboxylate transporter substrate binding protein [Burkholderiales bacterium]|nr:tripartite tricarboxylate transporter substrate binding protein [Burkholderiales bacterium]
MPNKSQPFARIGFCALWGWCTLTNAASAPADYPNRPIRVIVPLAPGGGSDYTARFIGARLADRLKQSVVVDNRPAASGIVGTDLVAKAVPDGYTILLAYSTHAQSAQLFSKLPYDPIKDFAPVTEVIATPLTMLLNPTVPAKTVQEFIAYAKANSGKLNYGSSGPGSSPHLATELFASMAGIKMTHIPYKGVALYVTAQIGNEIQFSFSNLFTTMPHWKSGRLRLIATGGVKRSEAFPDLPTIAESGVPGFDAMTWYGYMAPAKTPRAIVDRLQKEIAAIVHTPEVRDTFVSQANDPVVNTPDEFAKIIRNDADKWGALGKKLGVKLD